MAQRKSSAVKNEPIVLSGRVYLDGILADDLPSLAPPARWMVGDIKLHNVRKAGERPRFGQTVNFAGFIVANVYDGKKFRRLLLRKLGAVESTYVGPVGRREVSASVVRYLRTLVRRQAVWFEQDHGYEVTRNTVPVPAPQAVSQPPAGATIPAAVTKTAVSPAAPITSPVAVTVTVQVSVEGKPAALTTSHHGRPSVSRRRKGSRKAEDKNQLPLFTDLK